MARWMAVLLIATAGVGRVQAKPIEQMVAAEVEAEGHQPSAPVHHDEALVGEPSPPHHVDGAFVEKKEQAEQDKARAHADSTSVPADTDQHDGYIDNERTPEVPKHANRVVMTDETSPPSDEVLDEYKEPPLLSEDELLYADQGGADLDGYLGGMEDGEVDHEADEEYQRYLREMTDEMLSNNELRNDVIQEYKSMMQESSNNGMDIDQEVKDLYKIAIDMYDSEARTKLQEQERDILNRQRRGVKERIHHEENLEHKAQQFDFHDPDAWLWNEDLNNDHKKRIKEIAHARADVLNTLDTSRKQAFIEHEIARLVHFRELVQKTSDPKIRGDLISAHQAEQKALMAAKGHEPGHKKQLEEVWEQDGFDPDDFDAKTLFGMHDTNGDEMWDIKEIEAIMWDEAVRLHAGKKDENGEAVVDQFAVEEEMARMRDHVMDFMDLDKDMMVSIEEFFDAVERPEFTEDASWKAIVPEKEIKDTKIEEFKKHQKQVQRTNHKNLPPEMVKVAKAELKKLNRELHLQGKKRRH